MCGYREHVSTVWTDTRFFSSETDCGDELNI